jgi:hypothetical protein
VTLASLLLTVRSRRGLRVQELPPDRPSRCGVVGGLVTYPASVPAQDGVLAPACADKVTWEHSCRMHPGYTAAIELTGGTSSRLTRARAVLEAAPCVLAGVLRGVLPR